MQYQIGFLLRLVHQKRYCKMFPYKSLSQNKILIKRRGVSQIIASLFMLAIVASFGSILLLQGITSINDFNSFLAIFGQSETLSVQESVVIEHVRFNTSDDDVNVWVRNNGAVEITIATITLVKVDSQDLIINIDVSQNIIVKDYAQITVDESDVILPADCTDWSDSDCVSDTYRISVTTSRGNSFVSSVQPLVT